VFDKVDKNIEGLFTTSEEVDMSGAKNFDASILSGKYLINLDGFDKDTIINKTAAFYDLEIKNKSQNKKKSKMLFLSRNLLRYTVNVSSTKKDFSSINWFDYSIWI